jgi:hypothetical protein
MAWNNAVIFGEEGKIKCWGLGIDFKMKSDGLNKKEAG